MDTIVVPGRGGTTEAGTQEPKEAQEGERRTSEVGANESATGVGGGEASRQCQAQVRADYPEMTRTMCRQFLQSINPGEATREDQEAMSEEDEEDGPSLRDIYGLLNPRDQGRLRCEVYTRMKNLDRLMEEAYRV